MHTEVGDSSSDSDLSDIALPWMVDKAHACGLEFKPGRLTPGGSDGGDGRLAPTDAGPLVDSRHGFWAATHPYHRLTQVMFRSAPFPSIASSAVRRGGDGALHYHPEGFDDYQRVFGVTTVLQEA